MPVMDPTFSLFCCLPPHPHPFHLLYRSRNWLTDVPTTPYSVPGALVQLFQCFDIKKKFSKFPDRNRILFKM